MINSRSVLWSVFAVFVVSGAVLSTPTTSEAEDIEVQCATLQATGKGKGKKKKREERTVTWVSATGYGAAMKDDIAYCGAGQCKLLDDEVWCAPNDETIITASKTCMKDGSRVACVKGDPDACVRKKDRSSVSCH